MKKLLLIFVLALIPLCVAGQQVKQKRPIPLAKYNDNVKLPLTATERAQILEVYGDYANKYVFNNPQKLKHIKQILRNRVVIKSITKTSDKKSCPKLSEVSVLTAFVPDLKRDKTFNPNDFNPLKYNFEFSSRGTNMYQVDNTNYFIIVKSQYQ